jgi:hypothetical protein
MRLHKDESAVLEPYVLALANEAIQTYSKRYGFELKEPVIIELYPEHDDFAVRTSGLPGIGLLGVTFGYLDAMDSPTGRADADFHWGTTLWHELAHVFTLEKTKHLVPRWFSEGVSVYEEWSTGPLPGRHIPLTVMEAIKQDKFLPIVDLDKGFIHPSYEAQVIVSYMQAGLICEYVASRWGQQGLEHMLDQYAANKDTATTVRAALDISPEQLPALDRRGPPRVGEQALEPVSVDVLAVDPEHVSGRTRDQHVGTECLAQPDDAVVERRRRRLRRLDAVELVDELVGRDDPARAEEQRGQERALARTAEGDRPVPTRRLERAEDPKFLHSRGLYHRPPTVS